MAVYLHFYKIKVITINKQLISKWIELIINNHKREAGEINIIFTNNYFIKELNKQYLKRNYTTDIITFDFNNQNIISGDLYISVDQVYNNSIEYNSKFLNEVYRVIIHGILHLLGFNDQNEKERSIMREQENSCLKELENL